MKIGIDLSFITQDRVGVDQYVYNLLKAIAAIDRENLYFLYSNRVIPPDFKVLGDNFLIKEQKEKILPRLIWVQWVLPRLAGRDGVDLLHAPCYVAPKKAPCPVVITYHDMASWLFPEKFRLKHRLVYGTLVPLYAKRADGIITVSESTKKDLLRLFKVQAEKVRVIYEAAAEIFKPVTDEKLLADARRKFLLPEKLILFVGMMEPRKNIPVLIRAFKKFRAGGFKHKLVIAGKKGWLYDEIFETIKLLELEDEIIFTGYVKDTELPAIYGCADMFVYPSGYEGFGLPPLEAMACGVPVITTRISSIPEVTGDAAVLLEDPADYEKLAEAMRKVAADRPFRETLVKKGLDRAKHFSWRKAAVETIEVYKSFKGRFILEQADTR